MRISNLHKSIIAVLFIIIALMFWERYELVHNGKYTVGVITDINDGRAYYNYFINGEKYGAYDLIYDTENKISIDQKYYVLYSRRGLLKSCFIDFNKPISQNEKINFDTVKVDSKSVTIRKMLGF